MGFKHDPAKAAANLKKHGVSFSDAEGVLEDPLAVTVEDPNAEGEQRFITVGLDRAQRRVPSDLSASSDAKGTKTL